MAFIVNNNTILISDGDQLIDGVFDNVQIGKRVEGVEDTVYVLVHDGAGTVTLQNVTIDETNVLDNVVNITDGTTAHQLNRGDLITYTAANGVDITQLNGTVTIGHTDTSDQAGIILPPGTTISNIQLDVFGHITLLETYNLDGRYYTEAEADARFINADGDTITGPFVLQDSLTVAGTTTLNGDLDVNATNIDLSGTTTLTGDLSHTGNSIIDGTLNVTGLSTLDRLAVTNDTTIGTTLTVTGATQLNSTLGVIGETTLSNNLSVSGNTDITGTANVTGATTLSTVTVTSTSLLQGQVTAESDVGIQGKLDVWGVSYLDGGINVNGGLFEVDGATGNTTTQGHLTVVGDVMVSGGTVLQDLTAQDINSSTITTTGLANIGTTLFVGDATTLNHTLQVLGSTNIDGGLTTDGGQFAVADNTGDVTTQGSINVVQNLIVQGDSTLNTITLDTITITGELVTTGTAPTDFATPTTVNNTLNVTELTTLDGGLTMDGGVFTVADTTGDVYTAGTLTVSGNTTLYGTQTVTGAVTNLSTTHSVGGISTDSTLLVADTTTLSSTLDVAGLSSLDGGIDTNGLFTVDSTTGNVYTSGTLTVIGTTDFTGHVTGTTSTFNDSTTVGSTTVGTTLDVAGLSSLDGGIDMNGLMTVDQNTGNIWTNGTLQVVGTTDLTGDLTGTTADFNSFVTHTNLLNEGTMTTNGIVQLNSTLTTEGLATFNGGVDFVADNTNTFAFNDVDGSIIQDGTFSVIDASFFTGTMTAGDIDASTLDTTGNVTVGGTTTITGLTTLNGGLQTDTGAFTVADTTGNVATQGTLYVDKTTTLNGETTVIGLTNLDGGLDMDNGKFTVADGTGNTYIDGTLTVLGASDFTGVMTVDNLDTGTLDVTTNTTIGGTLTTTGLTTLNGGLTMDGGVFTVANDTGSVYTQGTLQVDSQTYLNNTTTLSGGIGEKFSVTDGTTETFRVDSTTGNIWTNGTISGPTNFTIDPASDGGTLGTLIVDGNLQVTGTTTTVSSTEVTIADTNIVLASNATTAAEANGGGITVNGANATITYQASTDSWQFNKDVRIPDDLFVTGAVTVDGLTSLDGGLDMDGVFTVQDGTGNVWTNGTLQVVGTSNFTGHMTTTTIDATDVVVETLIVEDDIITLGSVNTTPAEANGGGMVLDLGASNATITYSSANDAWVSNKELIVQGDIQTDDGNKLLMGTGDDLQIWHDGTNSRIDSNTGLLQINGQTGTQILDNDGSVQINVVEDGAVSLAYNGSTKIATKSTGIDITGRLDVSEDIRARTVTVWGNSGFIMEDGVSRITHNDGGGDAQIRFGHDYSTADERFTHAGTAFYIGGDLDTAAGKLTLKVASNGGAGNDAAVTWGPELNIFGNNITWNGSRILTTADEGPGNGLDADTLDGYQHGDFMKTGENTTTSGDIIANGFIATEDTAGGALFSYKNDAWAIIEQTSTRGGISITSADDSVYIGNGDVAHTINSTYFDPAAELVGLGSDNEIRMFSNLQNGWGTHNTFEFRSNGQLYGTVNGAGTSLYWNSLNDGSGSGLDADLLDGRQYSWFQKRVAIQTGAPTGELAADLWWDSEEGTLKIFYQNTWVEASPPANSLAQGIGSGLDSDLLDGQQGTYYLNYNNFTNKPTIGNATITINAGAGLVTGGSFTTNQTSNQTITINHADTSSVANLSSNNSAGTVIQDISFTYDGYGHVTGSSVTTTNLDGRYYTETEVNTLLSGKLNTTHDMTLTLSGDVSGSATFTNMGNATLSVVVADDSHNHTWTNIDGGSVNSWGGLRHSTANGYIDFGPANTTYAHIYTGSPAFYFNKALFSTGDVTAYASDKRLKENVAPITNAIDKVKSLSGMTYTWNSTAHALAGYDTNTRHVGVFAQDVQAVLPEAVAPAPFDVPNGTSESGEDYLTVKYEKLTPLLIEAVKELTAKVEAMQEEINQLRGEK